MILVLITLLFQLMYTKHSQVFNEKDGYSIKCLNLLKKYFLYQCLLSINNPLKCFSINNQECRIRPEIISINNNEPILYPSLQYSSK